MDLVHYLLVVALNSLNGLYNFEKFDYFEKVYSSENVVGRLGIFENVCKFDCFGKVYRLDYYFERVDIADSFENAGGLGNFERVDGLDSFERVDNFDRLDSCCDFWNTFFNILFFYEIYFNYAFLF